MVDITVGLAFMAGLVSFISPCVLPLVPAYVGYMGGQVTSQVAATVGGGGATLQRNRFGTVLHGAFFVLGFTFVFVTFGLLTTAGSMALRGSIVNVQEILSRLGGLIIILFGLHVMGVLPRIMTWVMGKREQMNGGTGYVMTLVVQLLIAGVLAWSLVTPLMAALGAGAFLAWLVLGGGFTRPGDFWHRALTRLQTILYMDTRQQMQPRGESGYLGSALMGVVFSAGWTPCIGPVYGAVLTMAANGGSLSQAGALLTAYSLGLGVPFLLTALALNQMGGVLRRLQRHMRTIERVSGVLLILIGLLVLSGQLATLSQLGSTGDLSYNLEHCATELFRGNIGFGDLGACLEQGPSFVPAGEAAGNEAGLLSSLSPLAASAAGAAALPDVGLGEGFLAPAFETVKVEGETIALREIQGSVTVLNFWATWCGPCRVEMSDMQAVYEARAADGLEILAINRGESAETVADFQAEFGLTFPLLMDTDESITAQDYQVMSMPTTYVLDENGVIVARHFGAVTAGQLNAFVDEALARRLQP
ncbi:MAG: redoxin domain-containing protein [Anaerolineae bacterium]|nr:redoxin domain-containing protein [Anaerolineae bacterium]